MGAVFRNNTCTFRAWAPFAEAVSVAGSFTTPPWKVSIPLARDNPLPGNGHDYWSVHVNDVPDRAKYKFITQRNGKEFWKLDPYCRDATGAYDQNGKAQDNNSIVADPAFTWRGNRFQMPSWNDLVIYEMHIGTFNNTDGKFGSFDEALEKLGHLVELGVNAIEVMPAMDFETETSMGYNPSLLFAIDSAYGTQKAVQNFVQAAHTSGIAVIFDVVYNHFGPDNGDCLYQFDGWSPDGRTDLGGIYFYSDNRAITDYGENRPDYGRQEVRQFIRDNAMMWLHEYQADGLRFDSTLNIRRAIGGNAGDRGDISEGWGLMQWINNDKDGELPWNLTIAEDLQNNEWITKDTRSGGAGFNSQWDVSFFRALKDAVSPPDDESRDIGAVATAIQRMYNNDAFQRIIYSESHDEVTVQNGVSLGRMPEKIWWGHADWYDPKKRSTLAAAITFTAPGIPMIFQGQEFLEWGTWTDNPANPNSMLDWSKKTTFHGIFLLYQRLIALRQNRDNNTRGLTGQHLNVFHVNNTSKVLAYHRYMEGGPGDDVVIVANFSHNAYDSYTVGFPRGGNWFLRFNSDWSQYDPTFTNKGYDTTAGADGRDGLKFSGNVGLGPYSAIILSQ